MAKTNAQLSISVSPTRLPALLAHRHRQTSSGGAETMRLLVCDEPPDDLAPSAWSLSPQASPLLDDIFTGAGFSIQEISTRRSGDGLHLVARVHREHTLADSVGPRMRILFSGLNPSLKSADLGYGFAGPSNRFWKAAIESGLVTHPRDPPAILDVDRVGMTDLAKRATARAGEITEAEFRAGLIRLEHLTRWLQPTIVCFSGITGWRTASGDKKARLGLQRRTVADRPAYVMPNPSGLNAHTNHQDLVSHFEQLIEFSRRSQPLQDS
jgi:TDG/mug DNA glycosylase family protein